MFDKFTSLEHTQQFSKENSWSFESFCSLKHLHNSFLVAYKGRNKSKEVILYKQNLEENLMKLQERLISFKYKHRKYRTFIVEDSKKRVINAPSFEDHILHHAVFSFLEEIFDKKFIENSFANRKGKGSHKAVLKLQKESRKYNYFLKIDTKKNQKNFSSLHFKYNWYLKMDITKYFQSVDQEILFEQIKRYVKDENFLFYVKMIIESYLEINIINPLTINKTGIPIGNVTSQLFANIYLHDLDFHIEHTLKPFIRKQDKDLFYIRYVDDFIFLAKEKKDLIIIRNKILEFLKSKLKLTVSPRKMALNKIENGIPFLGYNILTSKKAKIVSRIDESNCYYNILPLNKIKVRNDTIRRFKKRIRNYEIEKQINSLISFKGHCDLANPLLISKLSNVILLNNINNIYKYKKQISILYGTETRYRDKVQRQGTETRYREMGRNSIFSKFFSSYISVNNSNSNLSFYSSQTMTRRHKISDNFFSPKEDAVILQASYGTFFKNNKKAVHPVIATALLLVVAVITLVLFNTWFQTYSSNLMADVEIQSSINSIPEIETVIGDFVYIKTPTNLTIDRILVDGNECEVNVSMTQRMQGVNISSCLNGLSSSTPKITLITDKSIVTESVYLKDVVVGSGSGLTGICDDLPGDWVEVPGNSYFSTSNFCVMKYEAKALNNATSIVEARASNTLTGYLAYSSSNATPWVSINFTNARIACDYLNTEYSLPGTFRMITNREWMTIARNIENNPNNWNSSQVGVGYIPRGNSDSASRMDGTNPLSGINYRILELNGEEIWDLAGNVWQWVDLMEDGSTHSGNACGSSNWFSFFGDDGYAQCSWQNGFDKTGAVDTRYEMGPLGDFNSSHGMGRIYSSTTTNRVLLRGGSWTYGPSSGLFSASLGLAPLNSDHGVGFRCSYEP